MVLCAMHNSKKIQKLAETLKSSKQSNSSPKSFIISPIYYSSHCTVQTL